MNKNLVNNMDNRRMGKSMAQSLKLAEFIKKNLGKRFSIGSSDGVYTYTATFTSYEEMNKERQKQEDIKAMFTYYEADNG